MNEGDNDRVDTAVADRGHRRVGCHVLMPVDFSIQVCHLRYLHSVRISLVFVLPSGNNEGVFLGLALPTVW